MALNGFAEPDPMLAAIRVAIRELIRVRQDRPFHPHEERAYGELCRAEMYLLGRL